MWPYKGKTTYVVTRNPMGAKEDIHFITDNIVETISKLREEKRKDIWLMNGGEIISILLVHKQLTK